MLKKVYLFLLLIGFFSIGVQANQENSYARFYMKLGATSSFLPSFGVGIRSRCNGYGYDFSANLASVAVVNYVSLKGLFLIYP